MQSKANAAEIYASKAMDQVLVLPQTNSNDYQLCSLEKIVQLVESENVELHEVIFNDNKLIKFYIDIEYTTNSESATEFENILDTLNSFFLQVYSESLRVSCSYAGREVLGRFKNSYHVIVHNIEFTTPLGMKWLINKVFKDNELLNCIDLAVYSSGRRLFRIPMTCKSNAKTGQLLEDTKLVPITTNYDLLPSINPLTDYFISAGRHTNTGNHVLFGDPNHPPSDQIEQGSNKVTCVHHETSLVSTKETIDLDKIKYILEALPEKYYTNYEEWHRIGLALSTIQNGEALFHEFSKKGKNYDYYAASMFFKARNNHNCSVTIATLYYYAKLEGIIPPKKEVVIQEQKSLAEFLNTSNGLFIDDEDNFADQMIKYCRFSPENHSYIYKVVSQDYEKPESEWCFGKQTATERMFSLYHILVEREVATKKSVGTKTVKLGMNEFVRNHISKIAVDKVIYLPGYVEDPRLFNTCPAIRATTLPRPTTSSVITKERKEQALKDLQMILDHIRVVLANDREDIYEFIVNWLASIVQFPNKKTKTALTFTSKPGAGKSMFWDFIRDMFGKSLTAVASDIKHITGDFNSMIQGKILTIMDETRPNSDDYNSSFDKLKSFITQDTIGIVKKGVDAKEVRCFNNYVFLSNHSNCIKIEKGDRRYLVVACSDKYVGNHEYFSKLNDALNDDTTAELFHYLLNYSIKQLPLPITEEKEQQITSSVPAAIAFLLENEWKDGWQSSTDLFKKFSPWCEQMYKQKATIISFNRVLREFFSTTRVSAGIKFNFDRAAFQKYCTDNYRIRFDN